MLVSGKVIDSCGKMVLPPTATFNENLVLVDELAVYDTTVVIRRGFNFDFWFILPKRSRKAITVQSLMNNIREVFGKNSKLRQLYKGHGYVFYEPDLEERNAAKTLVTNHLESIPILMNNRRMMVDVLTAEALL